MLSPAENHYDIVVQNSATPSADLAYNLGQKNLFYLNAHAEYVTCFKIGFQSGRNFIGSFSGSYNELRDKPLIS